MAASKKKARRGGARPGAGRKPVLRDPVSITGDLGSPKVPVVLDRSGFAQLPTGMPTTTTLVRLQGEAEGFIRGDVNQNGRVNPLDLTRFRQIINELYTPPMGDIGDYIDTNRNGIITAIDVTRYRQMINGIPPSTRAWLFETANHARP